MHGRTRQFLHLLFTNVISYHLSKPALTIVALPSTLRWLVGVSRFCNDLPCSRADFSPHDRAFRSMRKNVSPSSTPTSNNLLSSQPGVLHSDGQRERIINAERYINSAHTASNTSCSVHCFTNCLLKRFPSKFTKKIVIVAVYSISKASFQQTSGT